jgi:hypothetical protein
MLPTLGKINIIKITKNKEYKIGEIISFRGNNNKFYVHRIVTINQSFVSTKGDNLEQQNYEIDVPLKNIDGSAKLIFKLKK